MKTFLTLLVASTALTAAIGLPAWSYIQSLAAADARPITADLEAGPDMPPVILASNDDEHDDDEDDDDDDDDRRRSDRDDDDCDDDDDDDDCRGGARNPASIGTVTPPQNGLFGNGAPPQVQVK